MTKASRVLNEKQTPRLTQHTRLGAWRDPPSCRLPSPPGPHTTRFQLCPRGRNLLSVSRAVSPSSRRFPVEKPAAAGGELLRPVSSRGPQSALPEQLPQAGHQAFLRRTPPTPASQEQEAAAAQPSWSPGALGDMLPWQCARGLVRFWAQGVDLPPLREPRAEREGSCRLSCCWWASQRRSTN